MIEEILLTFSDGQSLSNEFVDCGDGYEKAIAILFEAGYNTTNCSFVAYDVDGNAYSVNDASEAELELTISQSVAGYYPLSPAIFAGIAKFKVRRGLAGTPFTTGAENTIIKVLKRIY